jgi:DNA repair exonuclease SbcCD nuclease subunit
MNNLVCISDCHLGFRHRFKTKRLQDYMKAFNDAVAKALKCEPDVILFAGDLVHHPRPDPVTLRMVLKRLVELAEKTQIVICIGNHEIEGHLSTTYTPIFSDLHKNIHVLSSENPCVKVNLINTQVCFYGFEFTRNRASCEKKLLELAKNIKSGFNILCLHQAVERYLAPYEISVKTLREVAPKFKLMLFGHVHKHQSIKEVSDLTPAYYIGSTERVSFNEAENPTGFMLFRDLNPARMEYVRVDSASMKQHKITTGKKTPDEINKMIEQLIVQNQKTELLNLEVSAEVDGDFLNVRHDWAEQHPNFTVLEVNVNPVASEGEFKMERITASEDGIREFFQKTGIINKELEEKCIRLFQKYGA